MKNNKELKEETEIMEEIRLFYQTQYKTEYTDEEQIKENLKAIDKRLEENDKMNLNNYISTEKITNALKEMKNNKSPGDNGLSKEFYVTFRDTLVEEIAILLNNTLLSGELPLSQRNAIVTLIYKKGDHRNLANCRPVNLE